MGTLRTFSFLESGDRHPLNDIFVAKLPVYGDEPDELIRRIGALSNGSDTIEWWETKVGWMAEPREVLVQAKIRYAEVLKRAEELGGTSPTDFDSRRYSDSRLL